MSELQTGAEYPHPDDSASWNGEPVVAADDVLFPRLISTVQHQRDRYRFRPARVRHLSDHHETGHDADSEPQSPALTGSALVKHVVSTTTADRFEQDMVDFVFRWSRYGGGSAAEIFEEFGLPEVEFFRRVFVLTNAQTIGPGAAHPILTQVRRTCLNRLRGRHTQ